MIPLSVKFVSLDGEALHLLLHPLSIDVVKLGIAVWMITAFKRLTIGLQAVPQTVQEPVDTSLADGIALG
jgi:hypothetical protein